MRTGLRDAMRAVLADWRSDLDPAWRQVVEAVELAFDEIDADLVLEAWEPIFPARRGKLFPGAPRSAHLFRAFDDLEPSAVRCVILGQDPYPCPAFATGRAFEAGNVASWRELEKMFSTSVRTVIQLICAARTGDASYARSVREWPRLLADIESGRLALEPASELAGRWLRQGVLLLNSALTLSRFPGRRRSAPSARPSAALAAVDRRRPAPPRGLAATAGLHRVRQGSRASPGPGRHRKSR
jgi:uracil-DNA glycosylase